jgi:hypothetical protein
VGDGTIVPVDDIEEAEEPSSHASSDWLIDSGIGASGGNLASFDLANDFWRSLISGGYHSCVDQKGSEAVAWTRAVICFLFHALPIIA